LVERAKSEQPKELAAKGVKGHHEQATRLR
jgi:hypothetical protein